MATFLLILIVLIGIAPLVIIYLLAKMIGIKEAWVGIAVMFTILLFLTYAEISSIPAPSLEESIRLYFRNDNQMILVFFYLPVLISTFIGTVILIFRSITEKRKNKN